MIASITQIHMDKIENKECITKLKKYIVPIKNNNILINVNIIVSSFFTLFIFLFIVSIIHHLMLLQFHEYENC